MRTMGEKIADKIERLGLSDKQFLDELKANDVDISKGTLSEILNDKGRGWSYITVRGIARYLGVSCDFLMTDTEIESVDLTVREMCKTLGLSEKSIETLKSAQENRVTWLPEVISVLIENCCTTESSFPALLGYVYWVDQYLKAYRDISTEDEIIQIGSLYRTVGELNLSLSKDDLERELNRLAEKEAIRHGVDTSKTRQQILLDELKKHPGISDEDVMKIHIEGEAQDKKEEE